MSDEKSVHGLPSPSTTATTVATNLTLQPPTQFDFRHPDEWPKWKRRFTQYLAATGLDEGDSSRTVSTLLYTMGDVADDVLTSTNITDTKRNDYATVINKFDTVRKNLIFE